MALKKINRAVFRFSIWLVCLILVILPACQETGTPAPDGSLQYSGTSKDELVIPWNGPAILHIETERSQKHFQASIYNGLDITQLVNKDGAIDEYRGYYFATNSQSRLSIQSDNEWIVTIMPVPCDVFPVLHIPGEYEGRNNAVILLDGEYGVATFNIDRVKRIEAWAFGPEGVSEKLNIKLEGDYKGKAVLPEGTGWLVISASGIWSVKILEPCCEAH